MRVPGRSPIHRGTILLTVLVAALALAGCGGGEGSD
jgi:hypothetical protein